MLPIRAERDPIRTGRSQISGRHERHQVDILRDRHGSGVHDLDPIVRTQPDFILAGGQAQARAGREVIGRAHDGIEPELQNTRPVWKSIIFGNLGQNRPHRFGAGTLGVDGRRQVYLTHGSWYRVGSGGQFEEFQ